MGKSGGANTSVRERASRSAGGAPGQGFKGSAEIDRHIAAWNKLSFEERLAITRSPGGYKAWIAEHFGKKAAANTPAVSAAGKRVGRPPASAEEKAARTQARKDKANAARREKRATAKPTAAPLVDMHAPSTTLSEINRAAQTRIASRLANDAAWKRFVANEQQPAPAVAEMLSRSFRGTILLSERSGAGTGAMFQAVRDGLGQTRARRGRLESLPSAQTLYHEEGTALRSYVRAVYDETQAYLRAHGITEVTLYRGGAESGGGSRAKPFSSFSVDRAHAQQYADERPDARLYRVRVPAARILGFHSTGLGNPTEGEVVVLASTPRSTSVARRQIARRG